MSYTKNYKEYVHDKVSFRYPASQSGGTQSVEVKIPVDINIHVNTNTFDNEVGKCNSNVNLLTGAVVATQTAQIAAINVNSKKVANTIVTGFFGYIRSEISQQISELSQHIDTHLMHLKELSKSCIAKKDQMENDFNRISSRYIKIFDDLNKELFNRVHSLDKPSFIFKQESENQILKTTKDDLSNTISVIGKENGKLQSKISASFTKKNSFEALNRTKEFLLQQKKLKLIILDKIFNDEVNVTNSIPTCYLEVIVEPNQVSKKIFNTNFIKILKDKNYKEMLIEKFTLISQEKNTLDVENLEKIKYFFNNELNKTYPIINNRTKRIIDLINTLTKFETINIF